MKNTQVRVRFAPSPTGLMHLGNVRTALMNYLFAAQKSGCFILRIEDTDAARNFDPEAKNIIADLDWLNLIYNEGPIKGGPYTPYFQSKRLSIYQAHLHTLVEKNLAYRCYCSAEELEHKRQRQIAMKQPPRYDRSCLKLSTEQVKTYENTQKPFIWRVKLDHEKQITIMDLAHKNITFDLKNFSDFPLTRQDGSFTFMFANFVDDLVMKISHVLRGEDHLTNTAGQAALYNAFDAPLPIFWHMPILCNRDGKKMSKRDFGFSLQELKDAGYLPEAITNYLATTGGGSFENEIMPLNEIARIFDFENTSSNSRVKYDLEKLNWINHKWINLLPTEKLLFYCRPIIERTFPAAIHMSDEQLISILQILKPGFETLNDCAKELTFFFTEPVISKSQLECIDNLEKIQQLITQHLNIIDHSSTFVDTLKDQLKTFGVSMKSLFHFLRLALMGSTKGPSIYELIQILGPEEARKRIEKLLIN